MNPVTIRDGVIDIAIYRDEHVQIVQIAPESIELLLVGTGGKSVTIRGQFSAVKVRHAIHRPAPVRKRDDE